MNPFADAALPEAEPPFSLGRCGMVLGIAKPRGGVIHFQGITA